MFCVLAVDLEGDVGQRFDAVRRERQLHAFGRQQLRVLLGQRVLRLGQDAQEILALQVGQLDADRKTALQFGHQVRRLRQVERPRRDEEDVVGAHRAVARVDRRAFDHRQQIALHALARHIGAVRPTRGRKPCRARR